MTAPEHVRIAIVGAGFSGLGAAIRLLQSGVDDFAIFEQASEIGGVWRDNRYPGCACDVPAALYSFSFAPNPSWSRKYAGQAEILAYLKRCAREYGVLPHVRFERAIHSAAWDDAARHWRLETPRGPVTADLLIGGMGALHEPKLPAIAGRERFAGPSFHSARWRPSDDVETIDGKRVAVIGTGASAIQIVPNIQPRVQSLTLFQRTAPWIVPRNDRAFRPWEQRLFASVPVAQRLLRTGIYLRNESFFVGFRRPPLMQLVQKPILEYLAYKVRDRELRAKLTPTFTLGCKRILVSDDYLPALTQPNVEVHTGGIREIVPEGIVDQQGELHDVDTIVYATGFEVTSPAFAPHVRGRDGRSLADVWQGSPTAYLGTTVSGFPNLFILTGPNTGLGHNSMVLMIEAQIEMILDAIRALDDMAGARPTLEPRPDVQARFVDAVDTAGAGTVWTAGGCDSWYLDDTGRNSTLWPWSTLAFMWRTRFDPADYIITSVA